MQYGPPICTHPPTGRVISGETVVPQMEAGVCARPECIESAINWIARYGPGYYEKFDRQVGQEEI